jgi:hypothetical protein
MQIIYIQQLTINAVYSKNSGHKNKKGCELERVNNQLINAFILEFKIPLVAFSGKEPLLKNKHEFVNFKKLTKGEGVTPGIFIFYFGICLKFPVISVELSTLIPLKKGQKSLENFVTDL